VQISSNGKWVALTAYTKDSQNDPGRSQLFVYSTATAKLYQLSDCSGDGFCFSGPDRLAYVEANRQRNISLQSGQIVEVQLDESIEQLDRKPLVDVIWKKTSCLAATEDGLLFTSSGRAYPSKTIPGSDEAAPNLYHYTRADGAIAAIADSTDPFFLLSPDAKHVLFVKHALIPGNEQGKHELGMMNPNGSDAHTLMDISGFGWPAPMFPTWRGNDSITFVSSTGTDIPQQPGEEPRMALDVIVYKITAQYTLEPAQTLSKDWNLETKPTVKKSDFLPQAK